MNVIGLIAVLFFVVGWAGAVASWFYGVRHLFSGFWRSRTDRTSAHRRKTAFALMAFIVCFAFTFLNGLIGAWWGGWQNAVSR